MIPAKIKKYLLAFGIVLAIDMVWLMLIMSSFYNSQFSGFARPEPIPIWSAVMAWALIPLGIVLFVDPLSKTRRQSLFYGALYGFILYGLYDFTNYATLAGWSITLLAVDILWGTFLCAVSSLLLNLITKKWKK